MDEKELLGLGIPRGKALGVARAAVQAAAREGLTPQRVKKRLKHVISHPRDHARDPIFAELAGMMAQVQRQQAARGPRELAPWRQWGTDLDENSIQQLRNACSLPVAVRGALMPDAHVGYGLPIGGVLATRNAVIPYAVGVDIACRVKLSVFDLPFKELDDRPERLKKAIESETRFGVGSEFRHKRRHEVMDRDWKVSPVTQRLKDKAWAQLGTSGSGNHFVEFGVLDLPDPEFGLKRGKYLALLSHSGSRGTGAEVCSYYSKIAKSLHSGLSPEQQHLAWLSLDSEAGKEYWEAMELMGHYASANHACIHAAVAENLGVDILATLENHHNFAWKEQHQGETLIVHRKGATPAGEGVMGIIPGTMAAPAFVVRGKGHPESLNSAAHGAGRVMSRKQAMKTLNWTDAKRVINEAGVKLLSAGLDEVPMVYKNIEKVMAEQEDLVDPVARFYPRLVKMAPAGERAED